MTRDIKYRVDVLRNGAAFKPLRWQRGDEPSIIFDSESEIQASLSGKFQPDDEIDLLKDEIKAVMIENGQEKSLGVFRVASMKEIKSSGQWIEIEAYDRSWLLKSARTESLLHLNAGSSYIATIRDLLTQAGIVWVRAVVSDAVLAADREDWSIGTDLLSIVNQLLGEIGYRPIWFDADGWAHLEPYKAASAANIKHSYGPANMRLSRMEPDWDQETDLFNAPNVFICVCSNADRSGVLRAVAENTSLSSAKSIYRRGMRIHELVKVDQVADQQALQIFADRLRDESLLAAKSLNFSSPAESGHGSGDVISISVSGLEGVYQEVGWSLKMAPGASMSHKAKRTVLDL